ncbi:MAG: MopE-related protein, partial [Bacteroidales bacterium]|nr:MopE-related protein [Bacteroidales bacterium]
MNKRIPLLLILFVLLLCSKVWAAVDIVDDSASNYVINHLSQAFSLKNQRIVVEPDNYNVRMIGEPVDSWSYSDGRDLSYLGQDSWSLSKGYFAPFPQRCGIVVKDLNSGEEYWFLTVFLSKKSKEKWERITDSNCPGGGDPVLVFPMAPPGYIGCSNLDNDGDGWTAEEGDCNDANNFVYPGAIEICEDGIDQDCNGFDLQCEHDNSDVTLSWNKPDDNRVTGYNIYCGISGTDFKTTPVQTIDSVDQTSCLILNLEAGFEYSFAATSFDADGNESDFSETISYIVQPQVDIDNDGDGWTVGEGDCNDNNPDIYPSAIEICGDGIDQDCNGEDSVLPSAQCVAISLIDNGYLISDLSSAFSISRDQGILINPERY